MADRAGERDIRYHNWLDQIVEHLRENRRREAADVIDAVPDAEMRDFALYLCLHVGASLHVLGETARESGALQRTLGDLEAQLEALKDQVQAHAYDETLEAMTDPEAARLQTAELEAIIATQAQTIHSLRLLLGLGDN